MKISKLTQLWLYLALIPIVLIGFAMGYMACFSSSSDILVFIGYILFVLQFVIGFWIIRRVIQIIKSLIKQSR